MIKYPYSRSPNINWYAHRSAHRCIIMNKQRSTLRQLLLFFVISNGVTVLQLALMPLLKHIFSLTALVQMPLQLFSLGQRPDGVRIFLIDYAGGMVSEGGGGGAAYFLAVEITLLTAQILNFFLQRRITFRSQVSALKAALWYLAAWLLISSAAAVLNSLYKPHIYRLPIQHLGKSGGTLAGDMAVMLINCVISFWIFFPIMKFIFRSDSNENNIKKKRTQND